MSLGTPLPMLANWGFMTTSLKQIQKENRKIILETIHGCSYEEALQKEEEGYNCHYIYSTPYGDLELVGDAKCYGYNREKHHPNAFVKKIIGKPLTLNRVLLALENKFCYFHLTGGKDLFLTEISVDTGKIEENGDPIYFEFNWSIKKETLEEQSEETQREINRLLRGG